MRNKWHTSPYRTLDWHGRKCVIGNFIIPHTTKLWRVLCFWLVRPSVSPSVSPSVRSHEWYIVQLFLCPDIHCGTKIRCGTSRTTLLVKVRQNVFCATLKLSGEVAQRKCPRSCPYKTVYTMDETIGRIYVCVAQSLWGSFWANRKSVNKNDKPMKPKVSNMRMRKI